MPVIDLLVQRCGPYADGSDFGATGPYERIDGLLTFAVDPELAVNEEIVDLRLAPRDTDGRVRFQADFCLLQPSDPARGNRRALVELPNRGRKLAPRLFNRAPAEVPPTANVPAGDGFLFRHGWTVAWIGWQWDVYRSDALMGLVPPLALDDGKPLRGRTVVEIHPNAQETTRLLANRQHRPYPAADLEQPDAVLTVREWEDGPTTIIPREQWRFARERSGEIVPDAEHVYFESGFQAGKIYDLVYETVGAPVVGVGLLAVRDVASFLRYDGPPNPSAGRIDYVYGFGMSQTGRMLRHFLHLGLNVDEQGRKAFDGLIPHVAGARRGEFNHRFGQPSSQSTPSFGHRFPFADDALDDPFGNGHYGLLDRQRERGHAPRIFYTNTSAEYWRGDGALIHVDLRGERDLDDAPEARAYLFASTQHGPGSLPQTRLNTNDGGMGRYGFNVVEYTPLLRAALANLDAWASADVEPPASAHPTLGADTAVERAEVLRRFAEFPDIELPDATRLPVLRTVDLGEDAGAGVGRYPVIEGEEYPAFVSAVDEDGNELDGLRLPDVTVPLGTHTGWNPRAPESGGAEQILPMQGFTRWFAATHDERVRNGDPRRSIEERYAGRDEYLALVRAEAEQLAAHRYILPEDIEIVVGDAAIRWDAATNRA